MYTRSIWNLKIASSPCAHHKLSIPRRPYLHHAALRDAVTFGPLCIQSETSLTCSLYLCLFHSYPFHSYPFRNHLFHSCLCCGTLFLCRICRLCGLPCILYYFPCASLSRSYPCGRRLLFAVVEEVENGCPLEHLCLRNGCPSEALYHRSGLPSENPWARMEEAVEDFWCRKNACLCRPCLCRKNACHPCPCHPYPCQQEVAEEYTLGRMSVVEVVSLYRNFYDALSRNLCSSEEVERCRAPHVHDATCPCRILCGLACHRLCSLVCSPFCRSDGSLFGHRRKEPALLSILHLPLPSLTADFCIVVLPLQA
mmetsp:Transcript_20497/g.33071  ORF Transcript_20497/g.33071 Transcript_20497/m.33071 type:complete len:311 (+) Transcript_20497:160-1092(+)